MAQLIKKASKGASIYVNGTKKDLTPEQWDAFKAEFGNNPEMISYFTDENNTSSFRMNDNGTITVNGMPLSTDSRKRRAKRTDDANTEKLYNFFNGLSTTIKGKNIMNYAGDYNLGYDASEDGKTHTLNRAAVNANAMKRLDALVNFDPNSWDTIEGFENFSDKTALKNYVDQYVKPNYEYLKAALTSGATKEDFKKYKDIFNSIGIYADKKSGDSEGKGTNPAAGTTAGIMGDNIVHDGNGGFRFKDDTINAFMNSDDMKEYMGKNLWLNNEFIDWANKNHNIDFSWITPGTGLFRINGKWVDGSKVNGLTGHDKLAFDNWVKHNKETVNGDNSMIVQYWGTNAPYQKYVQNPDMYFNGIDEGTTFIDDTGNYVTPNGERVFLVADKDYLAGDNYDAFGHLLRNGLRTVVLDEDTNLLKDFDISTLRRRDLSNAADLEAYQKYYAGGTKGIEYLKTHLNNVNLRLLKGSDFKGGGFGLLYDPVHKRYYWKNNNFRENNRAISGPLSGLDSSKHAVEVDKRLAEWILSNWDNIVNNKLQYEIDSIVRAPFLRSFSWRDRYGLPWKELGLDTGMELGGRKYNYSGGNFLLYDPKKVKELGHILEITPSNVAELHQHGGVLAAQKMVAGKLNNTESPVPLREVGKEKVIGDGTDLTAADWAEIAALGADVASLGASFIPGANIASAGIGAAGSVTDFIAQAAKDGLDWGDVGRFALNLGLDAATLIPFAGGAAKAAKTAKLIKQSKPLAKWIGIIASGLGTKSGILTAYENIVNGDDWTIEDIRTVVNGVRGFTNLNRLKGTATKKGKVTNDSTHTFKDDITISKKEYDEIMELPKDQQAKKMAELIKSKTQNKDLFERIRTKEEADIEIKKLGEKPTDADELKAFDEKVKAIQEGKIEKSAEEILKEFDIKLNKPKSETTWNPKTWDFWHRGGIKGGIEFKPEADTYWSPTKPKDWNDLGWWDRSKWAWNRKTAIRDAKFNPDNPHYDAFMRMYGDKWNNWLHNGQPIALNYYNNLIPLFTRDKNVRELTPTASYYDTTPLYFSYKKGGKVLKGKNGLEDITNKANKSAWNSLQVDNPFISNDPFTEDKAAAEALSSQAYQMSVPDENIEDSEFNESFYGLMKDKKYKNKYNQEMRKINPSHTTSLKSNLFQDIGKGLVDTGRLALNLASAKNQEKKMAEAIKASRVQYEMPNLVAPRYDNSSVEHLQSANRNAITQQRLFPRTSDSIRNFAMQQSVASNESKARAQEHMAYSQTQSAFNKMNNEFQNKAASIRADIATKQRVEDARVPSALKANEAKGQAQRDASIDAYLTQLSTDQRNFQHARRQAQANNELMEHTVRYQNDYDAIYNRAKQRALTADPSLSGDKLIEKIQSDEQFKQEYQHLNNLFAAKKASASNYAYNPMLWRYESFPGRVPSTPGGITYSPDTRTSFKKGGKLSYMQKVDLEEIKNAHKLQQENRKAFLKKMIKEDEQLYKVLLKLVK